MTSQYSHLQFFRRTPNSQLAAFFASKSIDLGLNLIKLKENAAEVILKAFIQLPDNQQAEVEAEFQDINALACEGGVAALNDEATFHQDEAFIEDIAAVEGFHAKVMRVPTLGQAHIDITQYYPGFII